MASSWHYLIGGKRLGPVSSSELQTLASNGALTPDDMVWRIGMDQWEPARKVKGLFKFSVEEQIFKRDAVRIGEFFQVTDGLPDREVAMKFSDGTSSVIPLGDIRSSFSSSESSDHVYDTTRAFILNIIRIQNGWLCLEFGSTFNFIQSEILQQESMVASNETARSVVKGLRRIDALVDLGITRNQLQTKLADEWLDAKDFACDYESNYPKFTSLIIGAYENYKVGLELWNEGAAEIPLEFYGGGFGLVGAAKGMAVGIGLQSIVNMFNNSQANKLEDRLRGEFWYASQKINVAHNVIRANRMKSPET